MEIPGYVQQLLAPYFNDRSLLTQTDVEVRVPEHVLHVVRLVAVGGANRPMAIKWVPIGASPSLHHIQIHPQFWPPQDEEEVGLLGHEIVHQQQQKLNPNFSDDFDFTARHIPLDAPPDANLYEAEAYQREAEIVADLKRSGALRAYSSQLHRPARMGPMRTASLANCRCA